MRRDASVDIVNNKYNLLLNVCFHFICSTSTYSIADTCVHSVYIMRDQMTLTIVDSSMMIIFIL